MSGRKDSPEEKGRRLSYRFRLYPTPAQEEFFRLNFEACAFVHDYFLDRRIKAYKASLSDSSVRPMTLFATTRKLTSLKKEASRGGRLWLKDADSAALVYALRHLDAAFANFFRGVKQYGSAGFPRPKAGRSKRSYTTDRCSVESEGFVVLPKVGRVRARVHREVEGKVVSATVSLDAAGRWHVSLNAKDVPVRRSPATDSAVGVFVGLDPWMATSEGEVVFVPEEIRSLEAKCLRELRRLQRKKKGSAGWKEQSKALSRIVQRITDIRSHEVHVFTRRLVEEHAVIVMREVDAQALMTKDGFEVLRQRRAVTNAAFGEIARQLAYKAEWAGREFVLLPAKAAGEVALFSTKASEAERVHAACKEAAAILEEGLGLICKEEAGDCTAIPSP